MHSPPTTTTIPTRQRNNSKGSITARKTISLSHVARRSENPFDVKRTVEKLRIQQQKQQNQQTNTSGDVATSENSFVESLSPLSVPSVPSPPPSNAPIEPAAKVKIFTNLLIDGSLGYSLAINYEDQENQGKRIMNKKTDKSESQRNNISESVKNQNVSATVGMASLLDPRPMARQYNAERSSSSYTRQQQITDVSRESHATFQPIFNYEDYRSANTRDTSRTEISRKPTPLAPPPPPQPPPSLLNPTPTPTYNGDAKSLHTLLTAMPTANSHRHEISTRPRRLSCSERSSAMSLRSGLPHWRSAINNIIGVSEPVPTSSSHSFHPYKPPPQQTQNQSANNLASMPDIPSRPIAQQAANLHQTREDLSVPNTAVQEQPQAAARESAFDPPVRSNPQPTRIRARRMTIAEPHPIRNTANIERLDRAQIQRIPPAYGNSQFDIPPPSYTSVADGFDNSHSAPIYQTFYECRHINEDMPPMNHQRAMQYMMPNRRQYSTDWRGYQPVYFNNGGGAGLQHQMMWMNNNVPGPYQPHFRYNEPPPVYEESVNYGPEPNRNFYYPAQEQFNRPPPFIRHATAPVFFYGYQQIARQHASNAWAPRISNAQFYNQEYN